MGLSSDTALVNASQPMDAKPQGYMHASGGMEIFLEIALVLKFLNHLWKAYLTFIFIDIILRYVKLTFHV